ncbi:MAG: carboxypeptidase-like regulatory domain-containing protein [Bryobacteraceae bacterium]
MFQRLLCKPILAVLLAGACLHAQRDTGSILGTVSDGSGGVVPGAKVTLTSEGTGLTTTMDTREDGTFIFTPIRIGTYTIEAAFQGFQKYRRQNITINIQQQLSLDLVLTPGELTQTVEVTTDVPILQTQSGSTGEVIEQRSIVNLPLNSRNYTFLARLTTGVTHGQPEGRGLNASGWFAANGTRPAQNNYLLDGIDNNSNNVDFLSGAAFVLRPPIDAIQEFKLQTSAFSAEFGRAGGAVLNATLRGGSIAITAPCGSSCAMKSSTRRISLPMPTQARQRPAARTGRISSARRGAATSYETRLSGSRTMRARVFGRRSRHRRQCRPLFSARAALRISAT